SVGNGQSLHNEKNLSPHLVTLCVTAAGVVYGDLGTSPLCAFREALHGIAPASRTPESIMGVVSLVFWALIIVVSIKYLLLVMRADNDGEGGTLALLALL